MGKETQENSLQAAGRKDQIIARFDEIPPKRVFIPESAWLKRPLIISNRPSKAREFFHRLASSRVTYRSQREHDSFGRNAFWPKWTPSSACVVYALEIFNNGPKKITAFEISVDRDAFRGRYEGLEPYIIEHEVHEAWLDIKEGFSPNNMFTRLPLGLTINHNPRHWSAVQKTFKMAERDGRLEDLLEFSLREYPPLSIGYILHRPTLEKLYKKVKRISRETPPKTQA